MQFIFKMFVATPNSEKNNKPLYFRGFKVDQCHRCW